jgi:hypothetical protein
LYPSAKDHCIEDLENMSYVQSALSRARRREHLLYNAAQSYEKVTWRLLPTIKEVSNFAYRIQNGDSEHHDDWDNVMNDIPTWIQEEKAIFTKNMILTMIMSRIDHLFW